MTFQKITGEGKRIGLPHHKIGKNSSLKKILQVESDIYKPRAQVVRDAFQKVL